MSGPPDPDCPVIALVSSAGGLSATTRVLCDLPQELSFCLLVLQHTPPGRRSTVPELLEARVGRRVLPAEDGAPLVPGVVRVAPSGCHMLVTPQRRISLIISGTFPPARPSADLLLTSMALSLGPAATAVILSGAGNDGATGATAVHKHGGLVLTTDRETSQHFSMPKSTIDRDDVVDRVVPVHELGAHLARRVRAAGGHTESTT